MGYMAGSRALKLMPSDPEVFRRARAQVGTDKVAAPADEALADVAIE